jgi:hypothetical protein
MLREWNKYIMFLVVQKAEIWGRVVPQLKTKATPKKYGVL